MASEMISLVFMCLVLGIEALECSKLKDKTNPFNVAAKGRFVSFSYRTTGTGTKKQEIGDILLMNHLDQPLISMKLTVKLGRRGKVSLLASITNWTPCTDETEGSQCSLTSTLSDVYPIMDNCNFNFTASTNGIQALQFEEEGDFLVLSVNKKMVGNIARPKISCSSDIQETVKGIWGSGSLYSCN